MVEAVGHENLLAYFAAIAQSLRPGGCAVIQVRTLPRSQPPLALVSVQRRRDREVRWPNALVAWVGTCVLH